jgi:hypothetical protein
MNEYIEKLKAARGRMVEDRRHTVSTLAKEFSPGRTPEARRNIIEIQKVIEAIDRAIQDEANISKGSSAAEFRERGPEEAFGFDDAD